MNFSQVKPEKLVANILYIFPSQKTPTLQYNALTSVYTTGK